MTTHLYGTEDNFNLKICPAPEGLVDKEFFHGLHELTLINKNKSLIIKKSVIISVISGLFLLNIGTGKDLTIKELAEMVKQIVGFEGEIDWDSSKPDGTPQKLLDVGRLHELGWKYKTKLSEGITKNYEWYIRI